MTMSIDNHVIMLIAYEWNNCHICNIHPLMVEGERIWLTDSFENKIQSFEAITCVGNTYKLHSRPDASVAY